MKNKNHLSPFSFGFAILDLLVLTILFYALLLFKYEFRLNDEAISYVVRGHYKANLLLIIFWLFSSSYFKIYQFNLFNRFLNILKRLVPYILSFSVVLFAISGLKTEDLFSLQLSFFFVLIMSTYLLSSRAFVHFINKNQRIKGRNLLNVVIIGYNDNMIRLKELINSNKELGLKLQANFVADNPSEDQIQINMETFEEYMSHNKIDYALICLENKYDEIQMDEISGILEKRYISIGFVPNTNLEIRQSLEINYLDSFPILTYRKYPLDNVLNQFIKRVFDILFTLVVFVFLLWWLLPLLSILIYFSQGSPILFKQKRNGLNGKEFDCLKFRTMRPDKDNNKKPTERDDPRVTKLGKVLRKTSLDELPQFINVLKGEMSIVGPRPHMVSENEAYAEIIKRYSLRHYVKPGITGLAQIKGYRGAVDTDKDMEMRIRTDIYYVRNWSFLLDLFIIYKTGKLMIFGDKNAI